MEILEIALSTHDKEMDLRVLLVEDDDMIGSAIRSHLSAAGHAIDWATSIEVAFKCLAAAEFDLVLLDLSLPDGDGLDILTSLRAKNKNVSVIVLSAKDRVAIRIACLNAGADDFMVKPFDLDELTARVIAVVRRRNGRSNSVKQVGELTIDFANHLVSKHGADILLSAREWAVLERLLRRDNAVVSKTDIENALYDFGAETTSNMIEVYISRLRKHLGPEVITTLRGIGYQIKLGD